MEAGATGANMGDKILEASVMIEASSKEGILVIDHYAEDWCAHVLNDPETDGVMVAYNPEHVRVTRISGNN